MTNHSRNRSRGVHLRTVLQMEAAECGAACLTMVLGYFGIAATLQEVRGVCAVSRDGINALRIVTAARQYGLDAKGFRKTTQQCQGLDLPIVVFWNQNHFLVVEKFGRRSVRLNDPAGGRRTVSYDEFEKSYSGIVLEFGAGTAARGRQRNRRQSNFLKLLALLQRSRRAVLVAVVAGVLETVPTTTAAILTAIFAEQILDADNSTWTAPILILATLVLALLFGLTLLQQQVLLRARIMLAVRMSSVFLWRMMRLPVAFFDARSPGGLVSRVSLNTQIAGLVSGQLATAAISSIAVLFYAVVLLVLNIWLGLAAITLASINCVALLAVSRARQSVNQNLQQTSVQLRGYTFMGIDMIDGIKATGAQDEYFSRWAGIQARVLNAQQQLGVLTQRLMTVPVFLTSANLVMILGLGGALVITGHADVPELIAFQVLAVSFFAPISQILAVASQFQNASAWLMQTDDILDQPVAPGTPGDPHVFTAPTAENSSPGALARSDLLHAVTGRLELRSLTFGYVRSEPPLIENLNVTIEPGQWVALVGGSGSGKSTVADLTAGIHEPWSGEVLIDGVERGRIPHEILSGAVAKVDQNIMLFSGTVADNIAFFDPTVSAADIAQSAEDACIAGEIQSKPGGFTHQLAEGGRNLSGGQQQRLELARALAISPAFLILDEATSALDAVTEMEIGDRLRRRGCSCLVVAHRLSTIRDCDLILVLDEGRVVEQGTHDELITRGGKYLELISHE